VNTGGNVKAIPKKRESASALTGRTMEQIAGEKSAVWRSKRGTDRMPVVFKLLRQATFEELRDDKAPRDVFREV
jgi:hypothetical protein